MNTFLRTQSFRAVCGLSLFTVLAGIESRAATRTWDGGGVNGYWATANNWAGNVAPGAGDDLIFPSGAARLVNTNNFPAGSGFNTITISGGGYGLFGLNVLLASGLNVTNTTADNSCFIPFDLRFSQSFTIENALFSSHLFHLYGDIDTNGRDLTFAGGGTIDVQSSIAGAGGLFKNGSGELLLAASNSFSGPVQIVQGLVEIFHPNALGTTNGSTTVSNGALLVLSNALTVPEPLVLSGTLRSVGSKAKTWTGPVSLAASNAVIQTDSGAPLTLNSLVSGAGGLIKTSPDVLTLNSNNTYTGATTVSNGTLRINGSQPGSDVLLAGGTLGGSGAVGAITATGASAKMLAPGASAGMLSSSNITLDATTTLTVEINGAAPGTGYDQLNVVGAVNLGGSTLNVTVGGGFVPSTGQTFTIVQNDSSDPITGTFVGIPEGGVVSAGAYSFIVSYVGGSGNDLVLTVQPPSTNGNLSSLTLSSGMFTPTFDSDTASYTAGVPYVINSVTITPTSADANATIQVQVNGGGFSGVNSGAASGPLALIVGANLIQVRVTAQDGITIKTYTLTVTRLTPLQIAQQAYLKSSNTGTNDSFGVSVAISGDTVVVGAPAEDSNATGVNGNQNTNSASSSGAAYVFVRNGMNWTQQAYLKASNTDADDLFGVAVSISGDTIVVGAPDEDSDATGVNGNQSDNSASSAGAAYVFVRSGTNWSQQAYVKASDTTSQNYFGASVAVSDDTLLIGALGHADYRGAAYVFVRSEGAWSQQAQLSGHVSGFNDLFGYSVAISGETVVIGAQGEDSNATGVDGNESNDGAPGSGAAYVFVRNGTNWSRQAYLKASNTGAGDEFGSSVAIAGNTVVVAARGEDSNATGLNGNQDDNTAADSGAAYVFVRSGTTWSQQAYVKASNTAAQDYFGSSLAASDNTLVIGAFQESSNATGVNGNQTNDSAWGSGAAYIFVRDATTWSQQAYLKASNSEEGDAFGGYAMLPGGASFVGVAISGDTVVIGASSEDSSATGVNGDGSDNTTSSAGAAYIFNFLSQVAIVPGGGGDFLLQFDGIPGLSYRLERAPSVNGPWTTIDTQIAPASGFLEFLDTSPPLDGAFYRTAQP